MIIWYSYSILGWILTIALNFAAIGDEITRLQSYLIGASVVNVIGLPIFAYIQFRQGLTRKEVIFCQSHILFLIGEFFVWQFWALIYGRQ